MSAISRRELLRSFLGRNRETTDVAPPPSPDDTPLLALILDRFCLAHQGSFCSVCYERCPVPGAIITEMGKPRVNPEFCIGCRICHDVCPAPKNAVFLVPRTPRPGMLANPGPDPAA